MDVRALSDERTLQRHRHCLPETRRAMPAGEPGLPPSALVHPDGHDAEAGGAVAGNRRRDAELGTLFLWRQPTAEEEGPVPRHQKGEFNIPMCWPCLVIS